MSQTIVIPQAVAAEAGRRAGAGVARYDVWLIGCALTLLGIGLIMVASASATIADRDFGEPLYFFRRQLIAACFGIALAYLVIRIPLILVYHCSALFLAGSLILLTLVIVPGLGHEVNGSMRWLRIGNASLQASEPAKLCFLVYLAAYLVRHGEQVREAFLGFIKPVGILTLIAALLLLEPDYGTTVVLFATALGMIFLGGVSVSRFFAWGLVAMAALAAIAVLVPYRMIRLMTFMDPWADPYDTGFQLTQALIAFGRGEWFGVGIGQSIQKLFYLPEVHTDFIFAVIAEELGLVGTVSVILMFGFMFWRIFDAARAAENAGLRFQAYLAYGVGLALGGQALTNMGVNMGMLPTKGMTLPLISYGANSMLMTCVALGLALRVGFEARTSRGADAAMVVRDG
jgi:cell division protein FtsW